VAVTLQLPGAAALPLDADHRAADRVLLQLDLRGGLGGRVGVAVDEERVGVLVVDPEQALLVAVGVLQREVGDEVVVVAEGLAAADGVALGGDHVVGEPVGQRNVVDERPRWLVQPWEKGAGRCLPARAAPAASPASAGPAASPPTRAPVAARPLMNTRRPTAPATVTSCSCSTASLLEPGGRTIAPDESGGRRLARRAATVRSAPGHRVTSG
jgi:hypothetical protein